MSTETEDGIDYSCYLDANVKRMGWQLMGRRSGCYLLNRDGYVLHSWNSLPPVSGIAQICSHLCHIIESERKMIEGAVEARRRERD